MASRRRSPSTAAVIDALLPTAAPASPAPTSPQPTPGSISADLLAQLPDLVPDAELAAWLGVSVATIRRRKAKGKAATIAVLNITRVTAASANAQVQARIVGRLTARYRKALCVASPAGDAEETVEGSPPATCSPDGGYYE